MPTATTVYVLLISHVKFTSLTVPYADYHRDGRVHSARDDVDHGDGEHDRHHKLHIHYFVGCC